MSWSCATFIAKFDPLQRKYKLVFADYKQYVNTITKSKCKDDFFQNSADLSVAFLSILRGKERSTLTGQKLVWRKKVNTYTLVTVTLHDAKILDEIQEILLMKGTLINI